MQDIIITVAIIFGVLLGLGLLLKLSMGSSKSKKAEWKQTVANKLASLGKNKYEKNSHVQRQTIVELDKTLDYALINMGIPGNSMGERLKRARNKFSKQAYNKAWEGHKERNKLVHELNYHLPQDRYRQVFSMLDNAIRETI